MGWFSRILYGVDLDDAQARSDAADAALAAENQQDYGPGGSVYNQIVSERGIDAANRTYQEVMDRTYQSHEQTADVQGEVNEAFVEGLGEGFDRTTGAIRGTLAAPFKFAWASLPWQLVAVGLVILFLYMGGGVFLKGLINRYAK